MSGTSSNVENASVLQPNSLGSSTGSGVVQNGIIRGAISTFKIDSLKEGNWLAWQNRMTSILKLQKVYGLVDGTVVKPDTNDPQAVEAWEEKDLVAQVLIKNNLSDEQMVHVDQDIITTAAGMWQSLRAVHETRSESAITAAKCTFYGMRAADDANIPEHIAEMRKQYNKLIQKGCKISDEEFKSVIVMSLPSSWDYYVASYQGAAMKPDKDGKSGNTSQDLISILQDEYQRRTSQQTQAFYAQSTSQNKKRKVAKESSQTKKGTKKPCAVCGKDNHPTDKCHFKGKTPCDVCHRWGHKTEDCWEKDSGPSKRKAKERKRAKVAKADEDAEMSYVADSNVSPMNEDTVSFYSWYADSATTSHLTNTQSAFIDYKSIEPLPIYGVGKSNIWAYGRGTVEAMSFRKGKPQVFQLKETLFAPDAADNLLSIGRIDEAGGKIIFGNKKAVIYDSKNNVVVDGSLSSNRLYPLNIYRQIATEEKSNMTTTTRKDTWTNWHRKFGHVSISGLQKLLAKDLVDGFDVDKDSAIEDCVACKEAKQSHTSFPQASESRSSHPGELTHTDVWGPASTTSWTGMRYNITFIDHVRSNERKE